jgi:DNA-binding transcriptional LysR family regulator
MTYDIHSTKCLKSVIMGIQYSLFWKNKNMDRLDELDIFLAILDSGSLAAAGRKLRRSPPAVTRALTALEERLGARLLERTTRQLAPTEAGRRLADQARRLLADYDAAVSEDADAPLRGKLRVTAPTVFGRRHVAPLVNSYLDRYASMQVELILNDRNVDLIEDSIDVAIRIGPLAESGMVARKVGEVRRILVASRKYLKRRGTPASLDELAQHDIIFGSGVTPTPEWRFRQGGRERTVHLAPRLLVNDVEALLLALKDGRGIGRMLSYQPAKDIATGTLVRLLPESEPPPLPVHVVFPSRRHMAPKLRTFIDHAIEQLQHLPVIQAET